MPIIRIPCRNDAPPSLPIGISAHGLPSRRVRARLRFALSRRENHLSTHIIERLGLFPFGALEDGRAFYYIDLHFTVGLLGAATDRHVFRGILAMPSEKVRGLVLGTDLVRRGQLTVCADAITFAI